MSWRVASGSAVGAILKDLQARWIRAGFPRDANTLSKLLDDTISASDRR